MVAQHLHAAAIMPVHELGEIAGEILVSRIKRRQRMVFRVSAPSRILLLRSH
ncbi:MAG TPA: hypothetical protein VMX75_13010 [Spirochaetia bacterium]|nr:hypothetical protein [Spirochaetia bacterium]